MTRLVRPPLSVDQARALIAAAEDRAFKLSLVRVTFPQHGNRERALLAGAAAQLKNVLGDRKSAAAPSASCSEPRRD